MTYLKKNRYPTEDYVAGILSGNRVILSQSITLIESKLIQDNLLAHEIIEHILPKTGKSIRIGITGVPGVGKSSFIEKFGIHIINLGYKLAVLAIDPSSQKSGGSILGDKTRMETLAKNENAFIRPSSTGGTLGGVGNKTREALMLCEAAGFDVIIIETVGVGQSEVIVNQIVDFFLLLMLAGAGDELQGIKKGIMEMADCIAITKADGQNKYASIKAMQEFQNAIQLIKGISDTWQPKVVTCSALEEIGIGDIWQIIKNYVDLHKNNGLWKIKRSQQNVEWMKSNIDNYLQENFYRHPKLKETFNNIEARVRKGEITPLKGAKNLIDLLEEGK